MNTEPQIEPCPFCEDVRAAVKAKPARDADLVLSSAADETDRRRVAERQAARCQSLQSTPAPAANGFDFARFLADHKADIERLRAEVAAHRKHDVLRCDALMKAEAEVAKLTAACAAKDGVIIRFLNAPLAQRDGTPVPSLLLASARAALSDTAGANMIDASGAVEGKVAQGHLSTRQVWTAKDAFPAEWAGSRVLIVRKP